jgi:hypothetical protein
MGIEASMGEWLLLSREGSQRIEAAYCLPPYDGNVFLRAVTELVGYNTAGQPETSEYTLFQILLKFDVFQALVANGVASVSGLLPREGILPAVMPGAALAGGADLTGQDSLAQALIVFLFQSGLLASTELVPHAVQPNPAGCRKCGYDFVSCVCETNILITGVRAILAAHKLYPLVETNTSDYVESPEIQKTPTTNQTDMQIPSQITTMQTQADITTVQTQEQITKVQNSSSMDL